MSSPAISVQDAASDLLQAELDSLVGIIPTIDEWHKDHLERNPLGENPTPQEAFMNVVGAIEGQHNLFQRNNTPQCPTQVNKYTNFQKALTTAGSRRLTGQEINQRQDLAIYVYLLGITTTVPRHQSVTFIPRTLTAEQLDICCQKMFEEDQNFASLQQALQPYDTLTRYRLLRTAVEKSYIQWHEKIYTIHME